MSDIEIDIDGNTYRISKLDALSQFHVARKLAPVVTAVGTAIFRPEVNTSDAAMMLAGPIAEVVSKMSEEDVNYVIKKCLAVVVRKQDDRWAAVMSGQGVFM